MLGLFGRNLAPRHATATNFLDSMSRPIDSGIGLYFPAPHSYTGEDVLELQGHGGVGVLKLVLSRCVEIGARLAEPGEFTRRAFLNGKVDLAQAEAVADLIESASEGAARAAVRSLTGAFSAAVNELRKSLLGLRMRLEAQIDFPEEETDASDHHVFGEQLEEIVQNTRALLKRAIQGRRLREGLKVALMGAPNVGKSTLLNYLAGESIAIVTAIPGTTRDAIAVEVVLDGLSVTLVDTAGLRDTQDPVEKIGVARALKVGREADLILHLRDPAELEGAVVHPVDVPASCKQLVILNKTDLLAPSAIYPGVDVYISAKTGSGVDRLRALIREQAEGEMSSEGVFIARERHVLALIEAINYIEAAHRQQGPPELRAEELRLAEYALGKIIGRMTEDELLGHIFNNFCIGK
jgi:tRNA modification GTPase